jgi:hypothetical protein
MVCLYTIKIFGILIVKYNLNLIYISLNLNLIQKASYEYHSYDE